MKHFDRSKLRLNILRYAYLLIAALTVQACTMQTATQQTQEETILDAYWMLISVEGQDIPKPQDNRMAYIRFQETENDIFGYAGCNKFKGKYSLSDTSLKLSTLSSTRMSCPIIDTENKLMDALRKTTTYRKSGNVLTLFAGNKAVATFRSGNPEEIGAE